VRRRGIRGESEVKRCALASQRRSEARSSENYNEVDWRDATTMNVSGQGKLIRRRLLA